jgi:hypothetical protein
MDVPPSMPLKMETVHASFIKRHRIVKKEKAHYFDLDMAAGASGNEG